MGQATISSTEEDVFRLIERAKEGDEKALPQLLQHPKVQSRALMICQRIIWKSPRSGYYRDAEDLRQELFFLFWQKFDQFRCENGEASFWSFFETLARNIHLSQARKSTQEIKQAEEKSLDELTVASQENQYLDLSIKKALGSLNERELLILQQKVEGKGLVEIANEIPFDIGKSTVYRDLENIQKKFIKCVEGCKDKKTAKRGRKTKSDRKKPV